MEVTKKIAERILSGVQVVHEPGVYETEHRVSADTYKWEDSFDEVTGTKNPDRFYKIVNTKLTSSYLAEQANDLLEEEEWGKATNKTLSFRADLDLATKLQASIKSQVSVDYTELKKTGETALMIKKMVPVAPKAGSSFVFRKKEGDVTDEIAKSLAKASPEVNAELLGTGAQPTI